MPVERDILMMLVIVGSRIGEHCFKRDVGIGSKSQLVSADWERSLETSSMVTQVKDDKLGGVRGGGKWGEVEIRLMSKLVWSLWACLPDSYVTNTPFTGLRVRQMVCVRVCVCACGVCGQFYVVFDCDWLMLSIYADQLAFVLNCWWQDCRWRIMLKMLLLLAIKVYWDDPVRSN